MTCSRKFDRLLRATSFGLVGILAAAGCGGSSSSTADSGTPNGPEGGPKTDVLPSDGPAPVLLTVSPPVLDFGSVDVGQTSSTPYSVTVTNLGPATSLTPTIVQPSPFALAANTCNTLAAAGTCIISVSFTPTHTGLAAGTLVVAGSVMVSLTGSGSPPADFTQTDHIDLGTILVGATVSGKVTVTATNALTDLLCSVSSAGNIKADPTTTTCPTAAPGALAKSASCTYGFTFSSATAGAKTGDEVICNAGSVTKITSITAVVTSGAKLVISPAAPQTAANTGKTNTVTVTVANGGGSPTGGISAAITPANPEFSVSGTTCAVGLLPLGTCTVTVTFAPVTDGTKTAVLAVTDAGAPAGTLPTTVTITGVATGLSNLVITGGPDLGTVALGDVGTPVTFTVKNTGGTDATGVSVTSNNAAFVLGNDGCTGQTLAKTTGTCTVTLTFAPSATGLPGAYSGLLTATAAGTNPFNLPVTATATTPAILTIEPNPLAFNGIALNTQSAAGTLTITNTGGASTGAITVPAGLGNGFLLSGNTCSAPLLPTQTCTISITYTPGAITQSTWTFTVTSASGATATAQLTGTGKQPNVLTLYAQGGSAQSPTIDVKGCGEKISSVPCFVDTAMGQADGSFPKNPGIGGPVTYIIQNSNTATAGGINLESGLVTVTISGTNASDFVKVSTTCGPSLQPSQTCMYVVSFRPSAPGLRTAVISASSTNGGNVGGNMDGIGLPPISIQPCGYSSTAGQNPLLADSHAVGYTAAACVAALASTSNGNLNKNDRTGLDFGQVSLGANCDPLNVKWFLVTVNSTTSADFRNVITATLTDPQTPANFRIANASNTEQCNNTNPIVDQGPATCWISVEFLPQGTAKEAKTSSLAATGAGGGSAGVNLTGTSTGPLTIQPSSQDFGTVVVNEAQSGTLTLTVSNWSTTNALGPVSAVLSGAAPGDFRVVYDTCTDNTLSAQTGTTCNVADSPRSTCEIGYRFVPKAVGARGATLTVTAGTETSTATLTGVGVAETTITAGPATVAFGGVVLTTKSAYQTVTVTAGAGGVETGNLQFTLPDGETEFELGTSDTEAGTCGKTDTTRLGGNNPMSCTIQVRFKPQALGGLGAQTSILTISDPRDRTLAQKIALTGTGLSQLTISPTSADFPAMENGQIVPTTATFTVTNSGKDAVASPSLAVYPPFNNAGAASGGCANGLPIPGIGSAPANTCIIVVNYPGTAGTPGIVSDSPGVLINGGTGVNDSSAAALLTGTIQTPSSLKLVGFGASEPAVDLGFVNVNTPAAGQGGQAILLYRNEGGHDTAKVNYYFWTNAAGADAGLATQGTANADTDDFYVVPELSTCFQGSAILHSGQYCKVVVKFQPKHEGRRLAGFTLSDTKTPTQKVDFSGYGLDPASNGNDKVIITPNFASLIGTPSSAGLATTVAEYTTIPTQGFTITNTFTGAITLALNLTNTNFTTVAEPAGTTTTPCTNGAGLAAGSACGVWVKFVPATGATPVFQPGSLSVGVTGAATETVSAGMMGKVREGTVLTVLNPITGLDFGKVTRGIPSASMPFLVMNTGDSPTSGPVTVSMNTPSTAPVPQFGASGCGAAAGTLAAFDLNDPSSPKSCAAGVVLTPTVSVAGPIVGAGQMVQLLASAPGTDATDNPTAAGSPITGLSGVFGYPSATTMTGTCINPASLGITPTGTITFSPTIQSILTASAETFLTITNGSGTSTLTVPDFQTTSAVTFAITDTTNFVLDLDPTDAAGYTACTTKPDGSTVVTGTTCQEATNQVTGVLTLSGNTCCVLGVRFVPQAMPASGATFSSTLSVSATTGNSASVTLSGTAQNDLSVTTPSGTTYAFASVTAGAKYSDLPAATAFIITNAASAPDSGVLTTTVTGADFIVVSDTCQGITLPDTLPGQIRARTCEVDVIFAPATAGAKTGTLTVSGSPGGTATIALTGTGT